MKDPTGLIFLAAFTVVQVRSTTAEMGEKSAHGLILVSHGNFNKCQRVTQGFSCPHIPSLKTQEN